MKKIKLPFDMNPPLITYHILAHPLGIIGGHISEEEKWLPCLCNKYINCYFSEHPFIFNVYSTDRFFTNDRTLEALELSLPGGGWENVFDDILNLTEEKFVSIIKAFISRGVYVWGIYNEKYISAKRSFQIKDFAHDYLLYGFDDEVNGFISAGYTSNKTYEEYIIPYSEFYHSIFQSGVRPLSMKFLRFSANKKYEINFKVVLRDIECYLESTAFNAPPSSGNYYGIAAWYKLIEYLRSADKIDVRFTRIFMEHRALMDKRLKYFFKVGLVNQAVTEKYEASKEKSDRAYLYSIKYNMTQKTTNKDKCINLISSALETDKTILPEVLRQVNENKSTTHCT